MFNVNYLTPFQVAMNNFDLNLMTKHIIKQLSIRSDTPILYSYYLKQEHISLKPISCKINNEAIKEFIKDKNFSRVNWNLLKGNVIDFLYDEVSPNVIKVKIKKQKIEDNKTFLQKLIQTILNKHNLKLSQIYGIIAVDSKNSQRILNLTHYWNSLLISNGLISLLGYDEFFVYVYQENKEYKIPDEMSEKIQNDVKSLFTLYLTNKFKNNITETLKGIVYLWKTHPVDNQIDITIIDTLESANSSLDINLMFIPTHFIAKDNIRPYYGYTFLIAKDNTFKTDDYHQLDSLNYFLTGNIGNYICTGQQHSETYYGLTTLEGFNANSSFTNYTLVKNDEECRKFVFVNVMLSFEQYFID